MILNFSTTLLEITIPFYICRMEKRWRIRAQGDAELVKTLAGKLNVSEMIANLLVQRGIKNVEDAGLFFNPVLDHLHDPFLMKDMDLAVSRIEKAIGNNLESLSHERREAEKLGQQQTEAWDKKYKAYDYT